MSARDVHVSRTTAYLKRWRYALRDQKTSLRRALGVVFDHQIVRKPDAIGLLRRTLGQRSASVPCQRGQDDAMIELRFPIANGHWLEKFRLGALED